MQQVSGNFARSRRNDPIWHFWLSPSIDLWMDDVEHKNEGSQSVRHKEGREEEGRGQQNTVKEVILQATKIAAGSHCDKKATFGSDAQISFSTSSLMSST